MRSRGARLRSAVMEPGKVGRTAYGRLTRLTSRHPSLRRLWPATWSHEADGVIPTTQEAYIVPWIHKGAQVGHQMASWSAVVFRARSLGIGFANPGVSQDPDDFFGLASYGVPSREVEELKSLRHVRLPPIGDERDTRGTDLWHKIVQAHRSRGGSPILFHAPLDSPIYDQVAVEDVLRECYWKTRQSPSRQPRAFHVAVHVRRGDVTAEQARDSPQMAQRWLDVAWYEALLEDLLRNLGALGVEAQVTIHAIGDVSDLQRLAKLPNIELRANRPRAEDFEALAFADLLVTAPSSFSFTAALVSRGAVIAPLPWWHRVPDEGRWIALPQGSTPTLEQLHRALSASGAIA
jgi:hypothetical protein